MLLKSKNSLEGYIRKSRYTGTVELLKQIIWPLCAVKLEKFYYLKVTSKLLNNLFYTYFITLQHLLFGGLYVK